LGRYEEALTAAKKAVHLQPNSLFARIDLTSCYSLLAREEEARTEAAEVLKIDPKFSLARAKKTWPHKNQFQLERVIESLRKAGLK